MRPRRWGGLVLTLTLSFWAVVPACSLVTDATTSTTESIGSQSVEIDPESFLDPPSVVLGSEKTEKILCADTPGAMRSYVVTFTDLGPQPAEGDYAPGYPVVLPSSPATPCSQRVAFTDAVVGHRYVAEVDGYEQPAGSVVPVCSQEATYEGCFGEKKAPIGGGVCASDSECIQHGCYGRCIQGHKQKLGYSPTLGTNACITEYETDANGVKKPISVGVCIYTSVIGDRHQVDKATDAAVSPRWTTRQDWPCGYQDPASPLPYEKVEIGNCAPLIDHGPTSGVPDVTAVKVLPGAALGAFACAAGGGTVEAILVKPDDPSLAPVEVPCSADEVTLWSGLSPAQEYGFTLTAFEVGQSQPTLTARCAAVTIASATVFAKCDPLVPFQ